MLIEKGIKFQISPGIKSFFNSAEILTVIRHNGVTVQFTLEDGKGRGSMPLQHLHYLLKRAELTQISSKSILSKMDNKEKIV